MEIYYFISFLSFHFSVLSGNKTNLMNGNGAVEVLLPNLSLSGFVIPLEWFFISLFFCLILYFAIEYNTRILFREKFKIAINIMHKTYTPLIQLRTQLEDCLTKNGTELASITLRKLLESTDCVIDTNQNVLALDKANQRTFSGISTVKFELYTYIVSIVNQCRSYANSHKVRLKISECSEYISCRLNENFMTAGLQYLINSMIEISLPGSCIYVNVSCAMNDWKLRISNCEGKISGTAKMFSFIHSIQGSTIQKIIRQHGGKIAVYRHGKNITFQIVVPKDFHCKDDSDLTIESSVMNGNTCLQESTSVNGKEKQDTVTDGKPRILLVMADSSFSNYLKQAFVDYFQVFILENPDLVINITTGQKPHAIIIDEYIHDVCGDDLCSQIKTDKTVADIPVIILVGGCDVESYVSHIGCGANRLEPRMINACKLRVDISMLIANHLFLSGKTTQFPTEVFSTVAIDNKEMNDDDSAFMNRILECLEKNIASEKYTIKRLSSDMGMSRTSLFNRVKEITGTSPEKYMLSFRMNRAVNLLASGQYSIAEIATMIGFCDARYFGKRFKMFFHICPSKYIENNIR